MNIIKRCLTHRNDFTRRMSVELNATNTKTYGAFDECIATLPIDNRLNSGIGNKKNEEISMESSHGSDTNRNFHNSAFTNHTNEQKRTKLSIIKIALLIIIWMFSTGFLMSTDEKVFTYHQLVIPMGQNKSYLLDEAPIAPRIGIILHGTFADENSKTKNFLHIVVQEFMLQSKEEEINSSVYEQIVKIPLIENISNIDTAKQTMKSHTFYLDSDVFKRVKNNITILRLQIGTNLSVNLPINLAYDPSPIDKSSGVICAAVILIGLYVMIIWEIIDRTFAAMIASTFSIGILALYNERPSMPEILSWIDAETLLLLFGMMILVGILSETGIFDYLAVYAYKIAKGKIWPLIYSLCLFTALLSAMLDNVTTLLLMTPVSIRLCEVMQLNPIPILTYMIIFSNIGGAMTPVGDPPNIIIASNTYVVKIGVDFLNFTIHMSIGAILVMIQTYFQLRLKYPTASDIRIKVPKLVRNNSAAQCSDSPNMPRENSIISIETYEQLLLGLQEKYPIRDRILLIKSIIAFIFVLSCFFLHSLPYIERLSLGWTTLLGVILLLILYDCHDIEMALHRVEWSTLLFFAVLFVLMESLSKLGLIDIIGNEARNIILSVESESRLAVAILIILWISAIASAFVDNIPLTTMMIRITVSLAETKSLNLPLQPLIWALSFGACLGGNGTLIGASANIICASVAEQHGYRFSFLNYFKIAFPTMVCSIIVVSIYLLICHVLFTWH